MHEPTNPETADAQFNRRIRAAATAAWWVFLVGYGILWLSYGLYLLATPARSGWLLTMWGSSFDWTEMQHWWMAAIIVFKLFVWMIAMGALWLSLWARQLRSSG